MIGTAHELVSGEMRAAFMSDLGMLGVSLRHRGKEVLRRLENLDEAAAKGSTAGIPLLYPWANRLSSLRYTAAGREVTLDPSSSLLHFEEHALPIHGVKWAMLAWDVISAAPDRLVARLDWTRPELLAVFPFRHTVETTATLHQNSLTIETSIMARDTVPVSFGFHPYFGIPSLPRSEWRLELPAMRKLVLDDRGIPTGEDEPFDRIDASLSDLDLDVGFKVLDERPQFSLSGGGCRITVEFVEGYQYAQIFAPKRKDFVAIEPMTAPTSALTSGRGLRIVQSGAELHAAFRIGVQETVVGTDLS
jgi:aldose 1-epimerase